MIAFMEDAVTWSNLISLTVGYSIGKAVTSYVIWKRMNND